MTKTGIIGLGKMGRGIARNIMKHGFDLVVYDVVEAAADALVAEGAEKAESLAALGGTAETVLVMVNTYDQCRSCLEELLQAKEPSRVLRRVIIGSTISMQEVQELEKLTAPEGIEMLDAPVSGGVSGAAAGTLTIMAAGADPVYEACLPLLRAYGSAPLHVGKAVGQGQAMKAVNQLLVGINLCATAEAFNMAAKCGLDLQTMFDTIRQSAGTSRIFENRGQYLIDRDFSTRSTVQIQLKDTRIACETAEKAGAPALLGNVARQMYALGVQNLSDPLEDSIAVIRLYEAMSGREL
ncbi:MAG: NAD(P)-dependent oxidoreductase [Lachnospiraceae bacterium]|nr:NAD(P)-dependent oxidoreductase [Lachnospiraceae bacterium]